MDRFKGAFVIFVSSFDSTLHSSMDRFKDKEIKFKELSNELYIPVWIDLKDTLCRSV